MLGWFSTDYLHAEDAATCAGDDPVPVVDPAGVVPRPRRCIRDDEVLDDVPRDLPRGRWADGDPGAVGR